MLHTLYHRLFRLFCRPVSTYNPFNDTIYYHGTGYIALLPPPVFAPLSSEKNLSFGIDVETILMSGITEIQSVTGGLTYEGEGWTANLSGDYDPLKNSYGLSAGFDSKSSFCTISCKFKYGTSGNNSNVGTFSGKIEISIPIPEPLTPIAAVPALGFVPLLKREYLRKLKEKGK